MIRALLTSSLLSICLLGQAHGADRVFYQLDHGPFILKTDIGDSPAENKKVAGTYMKWITETANYFLKVFELDNKCFSTYADTYDPSGKEWEREVRFTLWRRQDEFLTDFQTRYETKTIPGAYFAWGYRPKDDYGKPNGPRIREIAAYADGMTEQEILRHLYHEMGHLFMRTFIIWPVEVPSWIEEGTAEIFQFRPGNGTDPEPDRDERRGWLVEMQEDGSAIPWPEFMTVHNLDNLDFTWKDQLRSTVQYAQAWSVMEFMLENPQRRGAFSKLLKEFKAAGEQAVIEANQRNLSGAAAKKHYEDYLYARQEALFKKTYGGDLLKIEGLWKEWIAKSYTKDVKKNPILRYHRGGWYLLRAEVSKDDAEREAFLVKAEAIFQECLTESPKLPETYVGFGRVALARKESVKAGEAFAKALELGADSFDALLYGGIALIQSGRPADAVEGLKKAAEQRPTHFEANYYLGLALTMAKGDGELAKTHLARARGMKADKASQCAMVEGMVDYQQGDVANAMTSFLRASNDARGNPIPVLAFALCKASNGEDETAAALLNQASGQGNPFAKPVLELIQAGKAPKLGFSKGGTVLVLGVTKIAGED